MGGVAAIAQVEAAGVEVRIAYQSFNFRARQKARPFYDLRQAAGLPERPTGAVANNGDGGVVGKVREAST